MAGEVPAPGLRRSSWRSDLAAGTEAPRRPQRIHGRRAACSWAPEILRVLWPCGRRRGSGRSCSAFMAGEVPAPVLRKVPWCADRVAGAEDPEGCRSPRAGELPVPGLRRSSWCSGRAAGAEDPGGPAAHSWPARCPLPGFGDPPGALTWRPAPRLREGLSASMAGEVPAPVLLRSAWCSDRAAGGEDSGRPAARP